MLVHCRVIPSSKFASTHLYTRVKRGSARVNCLQCRKTQHSAPGLKPLPLYSESSTLTIRPPCLAQKSTTCSWCFVLHNALRVSNERVIRVAEINRISDEIRRWRWNWSEHILCGERYSDYVVALEWRPEDKRSVGRPWKTWRRMEEEKRHQARWKDWNIGRITPKVSMEWIETECCGLMCLLAW